MRKSFSFLMVAALTGALGFLPTHAQAQNTIEPLTRAQTQSLPSSFADLAEKLLPSVVNISSTVRMTAPENYPQMPGFPPGPFGDFFEEFLEQHGGQGFDQRLEMTPPSSLGSGFIVDAAKGYIVTNNHVVKDAEEVRVTLHDDTTLEAEVVGRDEKVDIAVLKVKTDKKLTQVTFGDSTKLRVGDWVLAIGNPFGLGGTVTAGIVSAESRDIQAGPYDDFIQTDASINRGNSGGPMFNIKGEVIGINTAIFSPSGGSIGIGFAIPSNLSKPVIDQLIEFGHTRRGWIGVRIQTVTDDIAESLGLDKARGALVASVTPTGPSEKAGLQQGDVITEFNGKAVNDMRGLPRIVAETRIGEKATIKYWRGGKEHSGTVEVGELEKAEADGLLSAEAAKSATGKAGSTPIDTVGLSVRSLTPADREKLGLAADVEGVLVTDITPRSEAAEKGVLRGDVIMEINQQQITDPSHAAKIIEEARKAERKSVLLLINRDNDVKFVALRLNNEADKATGKNEKKGDVAPLKTKGKEKAAPSKDDEFFDLEKEFDKKTP